MLKHRTLTPEEFSSHTPNPRIIQQIEEYRVQYRLRPDEMTILDWGCGRGQDVLWFKERGYQIYGVDVDPIPIENGIGIIEEKGYDRTILRLLREDGRSSFPDNFFHVIFSWQVLEHVKNLDLVAVEMKRIMAEGAVAFHVFPAHRHIVEKHLRMPFVHWLPKSGLRKGLISMYLGLGIEPKREILEKRSLKEKVDILYQGINRDVYYRPPLRIKKLFHKYGFDVSFENASNPTILNRKIIAVLMKNRFTKLILNYLLYTFMRVELKLIK